MGMRRKKIMAGVAMYALLALLASLVLIPVLWMVSTAFKSYGETIAKPPRWIPQQISFEAFGRLWSEYPFGTYFKNSFVIVLFSMAVSVFASCLAGYGLTRFRFRGRNSLMTFILVTQMFPSVMLLVPFYSIIGKMHLLDTHLGLILVYISFTVPFCTWTMLGFFRALPLDLDEAARIDGCNSWQCFGRIILPLTLPGIASTSIYAFITSWNEYMFAFILTSRPEMKTLSVGIAEMNGFQQVRWNDMMAASLMASLPLILLFVCLQKYFVSGLTSGAVKS
ncbi:carbohydrate ABC transporter permease [Enterocloster asparagiformis]|nr:carbohydrate ABC transporter permease [Enterocloster asparagiformis]RGX23912.1 carbohydrate ABC transporter permease [Enterocloster asparagiformis]UWO75798.1 carbohydrate ABC transporter permease [[Clostridium] asparagiforme DSM 15981]